MMHTVLRQTYWKQQKNELKVEIYLCTFIIQQRQTVPRQSLCLHATLGGETVNEEIIKRKRKKERKSFVGKCVSHSSESEVKPIDLVQIYLLIQLTF